MKLSDALAPIDDVGEKVIDTTEEYVAKADDVVLGRVMRIMDHVSRTYFVDTRRYIFCMLSLLFIAHPNSLVLPHHLSTNETGTSIRDTQNTRRRWWHLRHTL